MLAATCAVPTLLTAQTRPPVPPGAVFRLTIDPKDGPPARDSGTAWLLRSGQSVVVVTAYHVLTGRAIARDSTVRSRSIDSLSRRITLTSFDSPVTTLTAGPNIPIQRAAMLSSSDIALLRVSVPASHATLPLATVHPAVGDTVWLVTRLRGTSSTAGILHPATVVLWDPGTQLVFYVLHERLMPPDDVRRADSAKIVSDTTLPAAVRAQASAILRQFHMSFSSGAPVIDAAGAVVGVNIAGSVVAALRSEPGQGDCCGKWPDDQLVATGVTVDALRVMVRDALRGAGPR
jgi:hypothetical protein